MKIDEPRQRQVVRYSYLWHQEANTGREQGRKDRPCAIVLVAPGNRNQVLVVPVTHRAPTHPDIAVEIPPNVKKQLGLDDERSWIITAEVNRFYWPGPDLQLVDETAVYGELPTALFRQVIKSLQANIRAGKLRTVTRTE